MTEPQSATSRPNPRTVAIALLLFAGVVVVPAAFLLSQLERPAQVTGVVVAVRAKPPLQVDSFDLLAQDGRQLTFTVGPLDISPGGFDAAHLFAHHATGQPVVVTYRTEGDRLVAVRLADGPAPAILPSAQPVAPTGSG